LSPDLHQVPRHRVFACVLRASPVRAADIRPFPVLRGRYNHNPCLDSQFPQGLPQDPRESTHFTSSKLLKSQESIR